MRTQKEQRNEAVSVGFWRFQHEAEALAETRPFSMRGGDGMTSEKFILDATAGFRMMWFNKHHPNCIYLDQRPECEPDIVGDFRDLKQFPDENFRLVVFDPPHDVYHHNPNMSTSFNQNFGVLRPETWQEDLKQAFKELWRVLKPYGILVFKWATFHIDEKRIQKFFPEKPLFAQITKANFSEHSRAANHKTLWFCFMKIPEAEASA